MEKFIHQSDYITQIRSEVLETIIDDNDDVLDNAENAGIDELKSYLTQRYDTDKIFAPVNDWSKSDTYVVDDRVRLVADAWLIGSTYANGTYVANTALSLVYRAKNSPVAGTVVTDATKFDLIGDFGAMYYCILDVTPATIEIDNVLNWTSGDTRSALILRFLIDVVLYEIHCRINPRNIPEHRIQRRDDAIKWLKGCADPRGNINPNLPLVDHGDKKGVDIVWNSNEKQSHYY